MKLIDLSVRQPISITVAVLFTFLAGLVAVRLVAVEMTPEVEDTIISVRTFWENASPQEIESEVIDPQEEKLQSLSNLRSMTSESSLGQGLIRLEFNSGIDKNIALRDVSDKLREVRSYPFGVDEPVIEASDPESQDYIAWYILRSDDPDFDIRELQTFANDQIKPILERIEGVSEVNALGGKEREVQIIVDTEKLAHYGITLSEFTQKLQQSNSNASAGALSLGKLDIRLRAVGRFDSPEKVSNLVIRNIEGSGPVTVGQLASVREGFKEADTFVRTSGKRAIAFNFQREPGSNVLDIMQRLKAKIHEFNQPGELLENESKRLGLKKNLYMKLSYDATRYVSQALDQVQNNIFIGGSLAVAVLLLFLRSFRSLGIIAISIPVSMVGAVILMVSLGRTVNVISLAGIAFAVGMVVDNSIVVLENIYRHLEMGKKKFEAAIDGSKEVAGAVLASSLTTLIVFIPILLITDQVGQLFRDISLAIMTAVAFSYVVAVTVIPAAGAKILNHKKHQQKEGNQKRKPIYEKFISIILQSVIIKLLIVIVMSAGAVWGAWQLMPPMDYLPKGNRNITFGLMLPPPGMNLNQLEEMGKRVEEEIRPYWEDQPNRPPLKDVKNKRDVYPTSLSEYFLVARGGIMFHGGISSDDQHAVDNEVLLSHATRSSVIPGTFAFSRQLPLFRLGGTFGSAVKINLTGRDLNFVTQSAGILFGGLMKEHPTALIKPDPSNFNLNVQEVQVNLKEAEIVKAGLTKNDVVLAMQAAGDGIFIGEYDFKSDLIDLKIQSQESLLPNAITKIEETPISTPDGKIMRLDQVAEVVWTDSAEKIKRVGRRRAVTIEFEDQQNRPLEEVVDDLREIIQGLRDKGMLSNQVNVDIQGAASKLLDIRNALLGDGNLMGLVSSSMFTSFVAVYLLMCILFQSWLKPLVIMFTVPLATFGGFLGLFLVHEWSLTDPYMPVQQLDVLTLLGFVILSGVVVNNAILIVAQADVLLKEGKLSSTEAISKASQSRVRPIFMSLLTSVGGMLPLILNPGAGSELYRGLGAVVVGGMLLSTLFTLILIPVLLSFVEQIKRTKGKAKTATLTSILFMFMGCQNIVKDTTPELKSEQIPEHFEGLKSKHSIPYAWWDQSDDRAIKHLIKQAMSLDLDLQALEKRIEAVVALSKQTKSKNYPSLSSNASITREKIPSFQIPERTNYTLGLNLDYTLDWLGRIKDEQKIQNSQIAMANERRKAHQLKLIENIILHYAAFRSQQLEIALLKKEIAIQHKIIEHAKTRIRHGQSKNDILYTSQKSLHQSQKNLKQVQSQKQLSRLILERWVGLKQGSLSYLNKLKPSLPIIPQFEIGTPNDLIHNRSDLRIASQNVLVKAAALDLSRKEIYPKLQFGASFNFYSETFSNWLSSNNSGHNFGPNLSWRFFEFGRIKQEKKAAAAEYDEAVYQWQAKVRDALLTVSQNLENYQQSKKNLNQENLIYHEQLFLLKQQKNLFKHGRLEKYQVYLTEIETLHQQRQLEQAHRQVLQSQVILYKSLGLASP